MHSVIDIQWWQLAAFSLTLIIPFYLNFHYQLGMAKDTIVGLGRMTLQLIMIGLYLEFLFQLNNFWINISWLSIMVLIGTSAIVSKTKLPLKVLFSPVAMSLAAGLFPLLAILTLAVIKPQPYYHAQYAIPLAGMLLGNSLTSNIVCLQSFFSSLKERWPEYQAALSLGASPIEATRPFVQHALQHALAPMLATMATTGLVTIPGMMTGQILGGATPMVAIKYQLMIMIAIFVMMSICTTLCLFLVIRRALNHEGRPQLAVA
ncbi:ABC transporter permease [Pseudoalteromonas sp. SMS1]|uniref:ABC transporter permease n=1 Tax=Pseudoalteromonas sp. SMS1 TaxID=2908894 RepID=UPI001F3DCEA8|nr:ABC transporter permease [Pseudoalteromonas sp. SMS1]MCF2856709.1 ABC transporter permease [Pseudoalteromonas sp. SMS1]